MPRMLVGGRCRLSLAGVVLALVAGCKPPPPPAAPAAADVEVMTVLQRDLPIHQEWIGTLDGFVNAEIRAQVTGYLIKQDYVEGKSVKKGDLLFEIDRRPFQAAYNQVKANFEKSELDLKRAAELIRTQAVAEEEFDNAKQANSAVKASLDQAQLNLDFTRVTSPIDGIAGIAAGQIGNLVGPATGVLTTVSTVDPIKVYFSISEQTYLDLRARPGGQGDIFAGVELQLILADGTVYPRQGKFFAADRQISADTGTLRLAATFPNPDFVLRPGQYVHVRGLMRTLPGALLVPERAVTELQGSYQVAVVDGTSHVHLRPVKTGARVGGLWAITEGLHPGDRIVAEGVLKVREGAAVTVHPYTLAAGAK